MGTLFSSKKDYNRVLAKQPRTSISIPKFDIQNTIRHQPLTPLLSIPDPINISRSTSETEDTIPILSQEKFTFNPSIPTPVQNPLENGFKEGEIKTDKIEPSSSHLDEATVLKQNQMNNGNGFAVSQFAIKHNDGRRTEENHASFSPSYSSVLEHNGRQHSVKPKHRTEQRYVQCFDDETQTMRLFEVTDYIPTKKVRSYRHSHQSLLNNELFQTTPLTTPRSDQRPIIMQISGNRSQTSLVPAYTHRRSSKSPSSRSNVKDFSNYNTSSPIAISPRKHRTGMKMKKYNGIDRSNETNENYQRMNPSMSNNQNIITTSNRHYNDYNLSSTFYPVFSSLYSSYVNPQHKPVIMDNCSKTMIHNGNSHQSTNIDYTAKPFILI